MKAVFRKEDVEKGIGIIQSIIGNNLINIDNKYINITNIGKSIYFIGFGRNRQVSQLVGEIVGEEEELENMEILYQINPLELSKALPFMDVEELNIDFLEKDSIYVQAGEVELRVISYQTDGVRKEIEDGIEKIVLFIDGFKEDATDYIRKLNVLDKMLAVGDKSEDDILITEKYLYTNMKDIPVDTRLENISDTSYRLDKSSLRTILDMAKNNKEYVKETSLLVDEGEDEYLLEMGNTKYVLSNLDTYILRREDIYTSFESKGEVVLNYEQFIKYLRLSTLYLEDLTEVYLKIRGNVMEILPDSAYAGTTLIENDNVRKLSYSKAEMPVETTIKNLTINVSGKSLLNLLKHLSDVMDMKEFKMYHNGEDAIKFSYELGETILGAYVEVEE